jgi:small subunit ribosomal protein S17
LEKANHKTLQGLVVSNKMDKTVVVSVSRSTRHPVYNKIIKKSKKYKAHDEKNECRIGDKVRIMETRPLSKEKFFRVVQILEKAPDVIA